MQLAFDLDLPVVMPAHRPARVSREHVKIAREQLVLPSLEVKRLDNVFFGLRVGEEAVADVDGQARAAIERYGLTGQPLGGARYHVSLCGLGAYEGVPSHILALAREAAKGLAMASFDVRFDRLMSFSGFRAPHKPSPLVLTGKEGLGDVRDFRSHLREALSATGLRRRGPKAFEPHVTLLYDRVRVPATDTRPVGWHVDELVLIDSLYGHGRHVVLDRWPLAA